MSVMDPLAKPPPSHARSGLNGTPHSRVLTDYDEPEASVDVEANGFMAMFSNPMVGKATVLLLTMAWSTNFAVIKLMLAQPDMSVGLYSAARL